MPTFSLTNPNLHALALRGYDAVKPGRKLIVVHLNRRSGYSSYYLEYTAVTGVVELSGNELNRINGFSLYGHGSEEKKYKVILLRNERGVLEYLHAADAGVLPYSLGTNRTMWNPANFTLDKKALKKLGIKISK